MPRVVPLKPPPDPEAAYFVAYQVGDGDFTVVSENLEAIHLIILRKYVEEMENELVGRE